MSESNGHAKPEPGEPESGEQPAPPPPPMPEKTPERLRAEELMLWPWRILLLVASVWALVYGIIGLVAPVEKLEELATETVHGSLQIGVTIFLGAELAYYLYLSASLRSCREWGMWVWLLGMIAVVMNLRFGI